MPDNTLYSSGSDPYFSKCDYLEMDLASGLWRGKSDRTFFGGEPQIWLSDPDLVKFCIIFPGVLGGGLTVLLYLSAIRGSPQILWNRQLVDGCTGLKKIIHIILPNISFMIFIQLIMCVITTMQMLDAPYMYASGGPSGASTTQGIFILMHLMMI